MLGIDTRCYMMNKLDPIKCLLNDITQQGCNGLMRFHGNHTYIIWDHNDYILDTQRDWCFDFILSIM